MLTLEFGQPRLEIGEPFPRRTSFLRTRMRLPSRYIEVLGDWTLRLWCDWIVRVNGRRVASSRSEWLRRGKALGFIGGQALIAVALDAQTLCTRLTFDRGGEIDCFPEVERRNAEPEDPSTQPSGPETLWELPDPSAWRCLLRDDGTYSHAPATAPDAEVAWYPLSAQADASALAENSPSSSPFPAREAARG
jgi:hypothetical protein